MKPQVIGYRLGARQYELTENRPIDAVPIYRADWMDPPRIQVRDSSGGLHYLHAPADLPLGWTLVDVPADPPPTPHKPACVPPSNPIPRSEQREMDRLLNPRRR
jgi:hypothetical protein